MPETQDPEVLRLEEDAQRKKFWKLWGPYLSERQWGTVREDYSADGDVWNSFPFSMAKSRAYRWGEDGIFGFTDHWCRLCFAFTLWNGKDPILKERFFGLAGPQGNHGEDVKELYFHLDSTPTHSYCRALYRYPQAEFPYEDLVRTNATRGKDEQEYEISDTGVFEGGRFFDLEVEYAKEDFDDILISATVRNRGPEDAVLHLLPTLWFRNTWSWGPSQESPEGRPMLWRQGKSKILTKHPSLECMEFLWEKQPREVLFAENETNSEMLFGEPNGTQFPKDAFHRRVIDGDEDAVNPRHDGTKCALWYELEVPAGEAKVLRFRLRDSGENEGRFGKEFERMLALRKQEADAFFSARIEKGLKTNEQEVARRAMAGLFWSKQFYSLVQKEWEHGDPGQPPPPKGHATSRNTDWEHLFSQDILLMPDKWEYPYFCAWDLAFHAVSVSRADPFLAKEQLDLLLREWYMHPNGQLPAYEWNFCDVNPPVHAWAAWRLYRLPLLAGTKDSTFLRKIFHKLILNFTWWVNRKDPDDNNLFSGGFLGLDNIGVFDRSKPLPTGGVLKQADGTAWMAFFCVQMLMISLELAQTDRVYEDMASKFFDHFVRITHAMNLAGGCGLWDEQDGFYYDLLEVGNRHDPLRVRSLVGLIPLLAATIVPRSYLEKLPEFHRRVMWFLHHRPALAHHVKDLNDCPAERTSGGSLLAIPTKERLEAILRRLFDEEEFLSPFGFRSLSKFHDKHPYTYWVGKDAYSVDYEPAEGKTGMFGGNSNWRGPVWLPMNYLLIEALRTYHRFYGDTFQVEFPTGSGTMMSIGAAAQEVAGRIAGLFLECPKGTRPCMGAERRGFSQDQHEFLLFHEYFDAETGRGCGASHQTGWTALIADLLNLESHWE